jgi:hypothetical protein
VHPKLKKESFLTYSSIYSRMKRSMAFFAVKAITKLSRMTKMF